MLVHTFKLAMLKLVIDETGPHMSFQSSRVHTKVEETIAFQFLKALMIAHT